jgi:hypothetical protein
MRGGPYEKGTPDLATVVTVGATTMSAPADSVPGLSFGLAAGRSLPARSLPVPPGPITTGRVTIVVPTKPGVSLRAFLYKL